MTHLPSVAWAEGGGSGIMAILVPLLELLPVVTKLAEKAPAAA
jgi:hypothetical protein